MIALSIGVLGLALASCRGGSAGQMDAAIDLAMGDLAGTAEAGAKPLALDFSVTGCPALDVETARCDGPAPLTLLFTPVASAELTRFFWTFDDTTSSSDRSPTHTYALPRAYMVTLTAGGGSGTGSLQQSHIVNVTAAGIGAWCDVDDQCAEHACICGSADPCTPVLSRGLCSRPCDALVGGAANCPDGSLCVDLSTGAPTPPSTPAQPGLAWRRALCLGACATDADCGPGLACRAFLAPAAAAPAAAGTTVAAADVAAASPWVMACFTSFPLPIGARCGDPTGLPTDGDCASRLCAALGAFGRCSADCASAGCPAGSDCARFGDGRNLCLARCTSASASASTCDDDPLLACEAPGGPGPLGFSLPSGLPSPEARYCAPKRCTTSADCGAVGTCPTGGGICQKI